MKWDYLMISTCKGEDMMWKKYGRRSCLVGVLILLFLCIGCSNRSTIATERGNDWPTLSSGGTEVVGTEADDTEQIETETEDKSQISLLMVGDVLLHDGVEESCKKADGIYDFHSLFSEIKDTVSQTDLALVNQEVILGGEELGISGYPNFNAPYEVGDALVDTGFNVILHGTNHALDKGGAGITNCLNYWKTHHPDTTVLGINDSQEAQDNIYVYEQAGIRIAILNYTYGTNGIPLPADMPYAVNYMDKERIENDLKKANELADFVIVCPHWGTEYLLTIDSDQQYWTDLFIKNGVDLVIGTHPHVIEPVKWVTDSATGNKMLVYDSLGNYISWTAQTGDGVSNRMVGGMAQVTIGRDATGNAVVVDYGVRAIVCHLTNNPKQVTGYFLSDYTEELASQNAILAQDPAFSKQYCVDLCNQVWGENNWK